MAKISFRLHPLLESLLKSNNDIGQVISLPATLKNKEKLEMYDRYSSCIEISNNVHLIKYNNSGNTYRIIENYYNDTVRNILVEFNVENTNDKICYFNTCKCSFHISCVRVRNNKIYILIPSDRSINIYNFEGKFLSNIKISQYVELNRDDDGYITNPNPEYPVSFDITKNNIILVLYFKTDYLSAFLSDGKLLGKILVPDIDSFSYEIRINRNNEDIYIDGERLQIYHGI